MDAQQFAAWVALALSMAAMAGPIAAGLVQLIKIIWAVVTGGGSPSSDWQALMGAIAGAVITAAMVWQTGVPLPFAIAATIVALWTPKASYDAAKALHQAAKNENEEVSQ